MDSSGGESRRQLREIAVRNLAELDAHKELTNQHIRTVAEALSVTDRTVFRWLARVRQTSDFSGPRVRLTIDDELRTRLAYWRGNVAALYRELSREQLEGGTPAPSRSTLQRAVDRDLLPGDRAGLRYGERARRLFDVFLQRPASHRNATWEGDHVQAAVEVDVEGQLLKPWITWFADVQTAGISGLSVTPSYANRGSILAALRAAISTDDPYGPIGGLPELVRIDRGKDFLSSSVAAAMGAFAIKVCDLPGYTPHLKGTIETINGAIEKMFCAGLPRFTHGQVALNGRPVDPDAPALRYDRFVALLLDWVAEWNRSTEHAIERLAGTSPLQAWLADPTPLRTVPTNDLWLLTMEDSGRSYKITTKGIRWRKRFYVADWMTGRVGQSVRVRYMPHHNHEVEVVDARSHQHLGRAILADQANSEQIAEILAARASHRSQLARDLKAAEKRRRIRYASSTTAAPAQALTVVTAEEAKTELGAAADRRLRRKARSLPALLDPVPAGWVLPRRAQGSDSE